jgi:hypothetical protein
MLTPALFAGSLLTVKGTVPFATDLSHFKSVFCFLASGHLMAIVRYDME